MNATVELLGCSNGPVSTMPGSRTLIAAGVIHCDDHADRWAQYRVQGETDSFGCEYLHLCASCADAMRIASLEPKDGYCEWHKGEGLNLRPFRDIDEGMAGPVYMTCQSCRDKVHLAAAEEMDARGSDGYDDYFDDDDPAERAAEEARWAEHDAETAADMAAWRSKRRKQLSERQRREIICAIVELSSQTHFSRPYRDRTPAKITYIQVRLATLREQLNKDRYVDR